MNSPKKERKARKLTPLRVISYTVAIIIVAMALDMFILSHFNSRNATKTATLLLNQVDSILKDNYEDEQNLIATLRDEYIVTAKTVAYILETRPEAESCIEELKKISQMMKIDEINLFDEEGVIYAGTEPKYYGFSFDAGEQMAFFKPMLTDRNLSLCQDVTPNTVEGKSMMYATSWNEDKTMMVQIGIEPVRLLQELKKNEIENVVDNMPAYEGVNIYVADKESGYIYGTTNKPRLGGDIYDTGLRCPEVDEETETLTLDGFKNYARVRLVGDYIVAVTYSTQSSLNNFALSFFIEFIYLIVAGIIISYVIIRIISVNNEKSNQLSILTSMAEIYYSMHLIDLVNDHVKVYTAKNEVKAGVTKENGVAEMMENVVRTVTMPQSMEEALEFTNINTVAARMQGKKIITREFVGRNMGWFEASFIAIETDKNEVPTKVIFVTRSIDDIKRKEERLIKESNTDELTGLKNRRAYEDDIVAHNDLIVEDNYVYVSIDINGLKVVNDTLGHVAGDELILGASECMKRCLGPYGQVYRIGGDEFVAMLYATPSQLKNIQNDLARTVDTWKGKLVDHLSLSCGYVTKKESGITSVKEIALLADKRMYAEKANYYHKSGVDRRGQQEAHVALCALYTKMLKVNLTKDRYNIINVDSREKTIENGFSENFSGWLKGFCDAGLVHPDDVEEFKSKISVEYLKKYFADGNSSYSHLYRRKNEDKYSLALLEITTASDYSNDNQNLFIYVKYIN
ncbi:MAG: GGDEF domain-containing protein [Lachnospiraceae bacterium]|nr:GGDEF domain-containing protein [Lachnospiraceae bacterium]